VDQLLHCASRLSVKATFTQSHKEPIEKELLPQSSSSTFVASRMILRGAFFGSGLQWDPDPVVAC